MPKKKKSSKAAQPTPTPLSPPDEKSEINPEPPRRSVIIFFEKTYEHQTMLYEKINKMDLKYEDIFQHFEKWLTDLDKKVKNYGKTGTRMQTWQLEFKEGMTDEINNKLEELLVAKEVKPGVWRKMANVLHRENKNKNLENMQKNMENMQEEVKKLREDIKWLEQTKMQDNVNELAEKIKEWDKEDVSQPDDQKNDTDDKGSELEEALESYVKGGPAEGSEEDKKLKEFEDDTFDEWMSKDGNSQKLDPMAPAVKEYYIWHGRDPENIDYKTEIKNQYIV